jgi:hypothetical protein
VQYAEHAHPKRRLILRRFTRDGKFRAEPPENELAFFRARNWLIFTKREPASRVRYKSTFSASTILLGNSGLETPVLYFFQRRDGRSNPGHGATRVSILAHCGWANCNRGADLDGQPVNLGVCRDGSRDLALLITSRWSPAGDYNSRAFIHIAPSIPRRSQ